MSFRASMVLFGLLAIGIPAYCQINSLQTFDVETWFDNHMAVSPENELYLASELNTPKTTINEAPIWLSLTAVIKYSGKKYFRNLITR